MKVDARELYQVWFDLTSGANMAILWHYGLSEQNGIYRNI